MIKGTVTSGTVEMPVSNSSQSDWIDRNFAIVYSVEHGSCDLHVTSNTKGMDISPLGAEAAQLIACLALENKVLKQAIAKAKAAEQAAPVDDGS